MKRKRFLFSTSWRTPHITLTISDWKYSILQSNNLPIIEKRKSICPLWYYHINIYHIRWRNINPRWPYVYQKKILKNFVKNFKKIVNENLLLYVHLYISRRRILCVNSFIGRYESIGDNCATTCEIVKE